MSPAIGATLNRVDGRAKVRGEARYSAEVPVTGLVHGVLVGATVASGRITAIDTVEAERADGVLAVFTHRDLDRVATVPKLLPSLAGLAAPGQTFFPMQDETIHYAGQPIALVVADTIERAEHAGTLIRVEYAATPAITLIDQARDQAYVPERIFGGLLPGHGSRGDVAKALAEAEVRVDATYRFAPNHHNPIEASASTAVWEDIDRLTVYDSTQGPNATQFTVAALLGLPPISIRVVSHAVGGSFGSKAMIWHHPALAALAARQVGRPVRLALTREQMFTSCGHREEQEQRITLGAHADGRITALRHHKLSLTSQFDDWAEPSLQSPAVAYTSPHYEGVYHLIRGNTITPTFMRAPGEATGMFALECAMDELAERVGIDPVELRLRNCSDTDPESGHPWSSSGLKECYQRASELFGWADRDSRPRREGQWLIGSGMASALYPVTQPVNPQRARARLYNDGTAVVEAGVSEFGTGVYTAMTQVAADALGLPVERVRFVGGSSDLPNVTAAVGSAGTSAVGSAVHLAVTQLRDELIGRAVADDHSPLHGADPAGVVVQDGRMARRDRPDVGETYADLMQRTLTPDVEVLGTWTPPPQDAGYGVHTFGAQMAEVAVDADLGVVRVRRMVGVFAPGRVLNRKTAHSQLMGGMLWGLGQALLEATRMDPRSGRWTNASLGDYLVAVNADAPDVVVDTIEVHDEVVNPLGMKGVGEIGVVGAAAAIANAVHHATGRRQYELPITLEKLL
ncbi:xanthine dehydrogenase family protein molybdopterin-binding subunit [Micromonospora sp. BL4]|uniref:xanthine dehydrogenase family protein molybdopterin-binding subunit n=1 Tax=Micromonospora sp. BL4 TaxID=2478710 RepID=UPI000EF5B27C|nr:xanthine dehydrogenase family protein molybdopterin-binding subunit [Micromonospora sp. BL4]RLP87032.1 xanthine dehydrogenase family protein molybdopterin-binding subunit [Micromonospora sp. BL4]